MRVYDGRNIKYQDKLAEKRRRVWILKILFFVGLVIAAVGFILYLLFFSGFLEIKELSVNGLDKVNSDRFHSEFNKRLNLKWLGLLEHQKNILTFDSDTFKAEMLAAFPEIKEISVSKEPPHALNINVVERTTVGIWCFVSGSSAELTTSCKYFDKEGIIWGEAAKSSGFLILIVEDMRPDISEINGELLDNAMLISKQLKEDGIFINRFVIQDKFIGDFSAFTSGGYELLFSMDFEVSKQLEVLEIFLADKKDDSSFDPQYIDLRINGRIYYK